ncbi:MAG: group III truncated hemoglobin [Bacteroidetes bacterium]|nr:MAG: group III truncated hemoglobin [Bacteroidota bacterium]
MKRKIEDLEDVKLLVNSFYARVRQDELLADIFNSVIGDKWDEHLPKMYRFWQTVLLGEHTYFGSPFLPHAKLPVEEQHFARWLSLFEETLDTHFEGEKAEEARWRARRMAEMFMHKIAYYRNSNTKPIL